MKALLTLILGVHRSGTSLLTNALVAAGASAGDFQDTKDLDNPDGYAEHPDVRRFNDRLLAHLGASWDNWGFQASVVDFDEQSLRPWRDEAVELLRSTFPGQGPFVLKDPRIATLLPFWERVVPDAGFQLRRIVIVRSPIEVAESQRQRVERQLHDFPVIGETEPMAALWAVTMTEVLTALPGDSTLLVSHADLIADPEPTFATAIAFAGIPAERNTVDSLTGHHVKHSLYRSRVGSSTRLNKGWMTAAVALFDDLVRPGTPRVLPAVEARSIVETQTELVILMRSLPAVRDSIARMTTIHTERGRHIAALDQFIWAISPLTVCSIGEHVGTAIARSSEIAEGANFARTSSAVAYTVAQLLIASGNNTQAEAWLDSIRPHFGNNKAILNLEKQARTSRLSVAHGSSSD